MTKTITAYIFDKQFQGMPNEDAAKLTHANYSFALIKNGRADVSHWEHENELLALMKAAPELKISLSVGGWGADGFSQAVSSGLGRLTLADSLCVLVDRFGFAGIDLDWEYPGSSAANIASSPEDFDKFPLFIKLLREKLGNEKLLTMAVGAMDSCAETLNYAEFAGAINAINIMSYDMAPWETAKPTWHHTALYGGADGKGRCGATSVEKFHEAGVPYDKLVLGAAFYGRRYTGAEKGGTCGLGQKHTCSYPEGISYGEILKRVSEGAERCWDEKSAAPYVYDNRDGWFITYDDPESLRRKAEYVKSRSLRGVMFWAYKQGEAWELLNALYEGMK